MIEVDCNLCGASDWRLRFPATSNVTSKPTVSAFRCTSPGYGSHAQIVQCKRCGLVYANPRWSAVELVEAYTSVEDTTYVAERAGRELTFEKHLNALENFTGAATGRQLLDVGAYIGVFVEIARAHGWDAQGIEPSSWAVAQAMERNLPVTQGTQASPTLNNRQFDVITMWDVIEHVPDPAGEFRRSYELLKPGGWLAVHTMDIDSLTARLMGKRWPWLMDMHLTYFGRRTLVQMLRTAGFEIVWAGAQGRFLRLGYLADRLSSLNSGLGAALDSLFAALHLKTLPVPINFGDLITVYARRPN
jgi:2-polyprenyl-3-methyl-5-hydroxy-6-metoxy-1,4-benzoquinol methylase